VPKRRRDCRELGADGGGWLPRDRLEVALDLRLGLELDLGFELDLGLELESAVYIIRSPPLMSTDAPVM
jgi:hypothetical protein